MSALLSSVEIAMAKTAIAEHVIPPITDEMGKYWQQPDRRGILVDDTHAVMSKCDFDALHEYSCSTPTGVYPGKMWKRDNQWHKGKPEWWLVWFGFSDKGENWCSNNYRRILVT